MKIEAGGFHQAEFLRREIAAPRESGTGKSRQDKPPPVTTPRSGQEENKDGIPKGVVGLLLEDHFKDVAHVRLSINFFEELAEIKQEECIESAGENIDGFLESAETTIRALLESGELSTEQSAAVNEHLETFTQAVNQTKDEILNTDKPLMVDLISGLSSAFEEFVDLIVSVLNTTTEMPQDEPAPAGEILNESSLENPTGEENGDMAETPSLSDAVLDLQNIIEDLRSDLITAFEDLVDRLKGMNQFHELRAYEGNGRAYNKFLAIMTDLNAGETLGDDPSNRETLNTVA